MNKTRILLLIILFLFVTNVVTIISGIRASADNRKEEAEAVMPANGRMNFFAGQLSLSDEQTSDFMRFNRTFNREARQLTSKINNLRIRMIDEMAMAEPDSRDLDSICTAIGGYHDRLKRVTVDYYLNLKEICNDDQKERLYGIFREMSDPEGDMNRFGRGRGMPGGGMGARRGRHLFQEGDTVIR